MPALCIGAADRYDTPVEHWLKAAKRVLPGDTALGAHLLNSALDVIPRQPIIETPGDYHLEYEVFSQGFPLLNVNVLLNLSGNLPTTTATLI